jgi:effector-binding domain-containing protein
VKYDVQIRRAAAQPIQIVRGQTNMAALPSNIRKLFDEFYAGFKENGNATTPSGLVATMVYFGPYDRMKPAHEAIHRWARENDYRLAGPSWEVYGHWSDDPTKLRTDMLLVAA